jgi:hypothetical protein
VQHRAGILHPRRVALPFFGLGDHVAHQRSQAARGVEANLERLGRKELMHALNPERFHGIEIDRAAGGLAVEEATYSRMLLMLPRLVRPPSAAKTRVMP